MKTILITGGAGYIGSHLALNLLEKGENVIIFDNLSTGHIETVETLSKYGNLKFIRGDLLNRTDLKEIFQKYTIDCVFHFAALSQVEESVKNPEKYYVNNVCGTLNLLNEMIRHNVKKIVFSSTASIYGEPVYIPVDENQAPADVSIPAVDGQAPVDAVIPSGDDNAPAAEEAVPSDII